MALRWLRPNFGTKSRVPINQIYTNTFDFKESISCIKTTLAFGRFSRERVDDFNQEKIARKAQNIKIATRRNYKTFAISVFWRHFRDFLLFYLNVTIIRVIIKKISINEHSCKTCPHGAPHFIRHETPKPP